MNRGALIVVLIVADVICFLSGYLARMGNERTITGAVLQIRTTAPSRYGGSYQLLGHFTLVQAGRATDMLVIDACEDHNTLLCDFPARILVEKR